MLNKYASYPENSRGRLVAEKPDWHRTSFQRDRDRILHSAAFRRLQYKTQVFVNHEGDHYRTRLTHSIEVAQITRSICKILGLCEDLSEAMALAHDIGHAPFGHAGEDALNEVMKNYGGFDHNAQTLKILTFLENRYAKFDGLNLTWETLEGLAKHNGPLVGKYANNKKQNIPKFILDFSQKYDLELDKFPSLEAQIASLSDDIAYNNHDIEDGIRAGLINIEDLEKISGFSEVLREVKNKFPKIELHKIIHETIRRTVRLMVYDLIGQTQKNIKEYNIETADDVRKLNKPTAGFSQEIIKLTHEISLLLQNNVYKHYKVNRMSNKAKRVVCELFELYMNDPGCLPTEWKMKVDNASKKNQIAIIISDFISGMTDRYALKEYLSFFDLSPNDNQL